MTSPTHLSAQKAFPFSKSHYVRLKKMQLEERGGNGQQVHSQNLVSAYQTLSVIYFEYLNHIRNASASSQSTSLFIHNIHSNRNDVAQVRLRDVFAMKVREWRDRAIEANKEPPQQNDHEKGSTEDLFTHLQREFREKCKGDLATTPTPRLKRNRQRAVELYMEFMTHFETDSSTTDAKQRSLNSTTNQMPHFLKHLEVEPIGDIHSRFNEAMRCEAKEEWGDAVREYLDVITSTMDDETNHWGLQAKIQLMKLLNRSQSSDNQITEALNQQLHEDLIVKMAHNLASQGNLQAILQIAQYHKLHNLDEIAASWVEQCIEIIRTKLANESFQSFEEALSRLKMELAEDSGAFALHEARSKDASNETLAAESTYYCAVMKEHGIGGTEVNLSEAREFYERAHKLKQSDAPLRLAILLSSQDTDIQNTPKAIQILKQQISKGINIARLLLANIYEEGYLDVKSETAAKQDQEIEHVLSELMRSLYVLSESEDKSLSHNAKLLLGMLHILECSHHPAMDSDLGASIVKTLADEQGDPTAYYVVGLLLLQIGSLDECITYLTRCTDSADAHYLFGHLLKTLNTNLAEEHFSKALTLNHAASAHELGQLHMTKDLQLAEHYHKLAHSQGVLQATVSLASISFFKKEWAKCREWCEHVLQKDEILDESAREMAQTMLTLVPREV